MLGQARLLHCCTLPHNSVDTETKTTCITQGWPSSWATRERHCNILHSKWFSALWTASLTNLVSLTPNICQQASAAKFWQISNLVSKWGKHCSRQVMIPNKYSLSDYKWKPSQKRVKAITKRMMFCWWWKIGICMFGSCTSISTAQPQKLEAPISPKAVSWCQRPDNCMLDVRME